jgi:CBS domain-containing protein
MPAQNTKPRPPARRVTFRRVSLEAREGRMVPVVFCPRQLVVADAADCSGCTRFLGLCVSSTDVDTYLRCAFGDGEPVGPLPHSEPQRNLGRNAFRAPVSEIMSTPARCVGLDTTLPDIVKTLLACEVGALPVLDEHDNPVGMVSKSDVVARYRDQLDAREAAEAEADETSKSGTHQVAALVVEPVVRARDLMTHNVYTIPQSATISRASALMAYEHVHHLLVLSESGEVVGVVSTIDVARWVARADDYVVPRRK